MSKIRHRACSFAAFIVLLPAFAGAQGHALTAAQIVALVKTAPQLKIDASIASAGLDPKTHPYVNVRGVPEGEYVGGYLMGDDANDGKLAGGVKVLAIPLESGGSGGIFTQILFARSGDHPYAYVGAIGSGGHLEVRISDGEIVATLPYYGANDPNCCPSKRIVQAYAVRGGKLVKISEKTFPMATPRPERSRF
ncbi:MAG: hypothetical protein WBE30_09000 [Candidatus Cybelea sp.]